MGETRGSEQFIEPTELLRRASVGEKTSGLTLRGAVVKCRRHNDGLRIVLRDTDYRTARAVEMDSPKPAAWVERGTQIEVPGELGAFEPRWDDPLSAQRVWKARSAPRLGPKASGLVDREECAARVRGEVRRNGGLARLESCGTLYIVTSERSEGRGDIEGELEKLPSRSLLKNRSRVKTCDLLDAAGIADVMMGLLRDLKGNDIVLAARGGGEWLDNFEDVRVIEALGKLAVTCPTYVAVGHASNTQELLEGIVHKRFATPSIAVRDLDAMLKNLAQGQQRRVHIEAEVVPVGSDGEVGEPVWRWSSAEEDARPHPRWRAWGAQSGSTGSHRVEELGTQAHAPVPTWSDPSSRARAAPPEQPRSSSSTAPLLAAAILLAAGVLALGHCVTKLARDAAITSRQAAPTAVPRAATPRRTHPPTDPEPSRGRRALAARTHGQDNKPAPAVLHAPMAHALMPALGAAAEATVPVRAAQDPATDIATAAAQRTVVRLLAPFELGSDLEAVRARCDASYGMWLGSRCRLPGGREVEFGLSGGLVQTLTVRQVGSAPVPLFSGHELASLEALSAGGRGPWALSAQPRQLTVQPRPHHPGL